MFIRRVPFLLAFTTLFALVACAAPVADTAEQANQELEEANAVEQGGLVIKNVHANMTLPSDTGSFWMEITNNGSADDALVGAGVDGCSVIELHEMVMDNDVMVMRQVEGGRIPIPAGETVTLKQGGLHVMCIGKEAPLQLGSSIDIALRFENAGTVNATAIVVEPGQMQEGMGDAAPSDGAPSEMEMGSE
jgi:hypothetical protein